ncbi:hypothetical protein [Enterovirga rhinocerotis]|uniref:hypothetical protein n=1 Tax=Enterovirga rhinocerotis TaxID=1339210 RepID=UPI001061F0F1|nr:hypothetical protein [Enterovirga rhinocerotis]
MALAAGAPGSGLGPDRFGKRSALAGFFGVPAGASVPVAVAVDGSRADQNALDIEAARLARGVTTPLPLVMSAARFDLLPELAGGGLRIADAAGLLGRRPRVAVLDRIPLGGDVRTRAAGVLLQQRDINRETAILVVTDEPPPGLLSHGSTVLEVDAETLTLARSPTGETWRRRFTTVSIETGHGEALALRPGPAVDYKPEPIVEPVEPPSAAAEAPWVPAIRIAVIPLGRPLTPSERASWEGYRIVDAESRAVPTREDVDTEGLHEITIVPTDRDPRREEASRKAGAITATILDRGLADSVRVTISDRFVPFSLAA